MSTEAEITYRMLILFSSGIGLLCSILTFVVTRLTDSSTMRKTYAKLPKNNGFRLNSEAVKCQDERKMAEASIIKVLRRMERRMALGNLVMRLLIENNDNIDNDIIKKIESDLGMDLKNRDFGIPD